MSLRPRSTTTAPSSPGPPAQITAAEHVGDDAERALGHDAGEATHVLGESIEIEWGSGHDALFPVEVQRRPRPSESATIVRTDLP
jgi:hypothetical protein